MQLNPYLTFTGNAEEAFEFYRSVLGGKLDVVRFGGTPAAQHTPPGWENKVLHARLESPAGVIMCSDASPEQAGPPAGRFNLSLQVDDEREAEAIFAKLSAGGQVTMPIEQTFWAKKFGMLTDKFGIAWLVNCPNPAFMATETANA